MRNIKLFIEYEGTNYQGWQFQPNQPTIQEVIEKRLKQILNQKVRLIASGRTDAGVHALAQVANFFTDSSLELSSLKKGLNSLLPPDIVIKEIEEMGLDFHARYQAKSKVYQYLIWNSYPPSAFYHRFSWQVYPKLDLKAMKEAAQFLLGKKDFSSFRASHTDNLNPIREILEITIKKKGKELILITIEADGFLKHMVRNLIGTLVEVGKGKITPQEFKSILEARDRRKAGLTAPPQGLFLKEVKY